jgi:hypothetical protein
MANDEDLKEGAKNRLKFDIDLLHDGYKSTNPLSSQ